MALIRETKTSWKQVYVIIESYYHKECSGKDKVNVTLYDEYSDAKHDFDEIVAQFIEKLGHPKTAVQGREYYYCETNNERAAVKLTYGNIY